VVGGDAENRIKEQGMLFAQRTSCATMRANQVRLYLSTVAYILLRALRAFGLAETELAAAQGDTLRVKLLKIGAVVRVSVRRVVVALSEAYPLRAVFVRVTEHRKRMMAEGHDTAAGLVICGKEGGFLRISDVRRLSFCRSCRL